MPASKQRDLLLASLSRFYATRANAARLRAIMSGDAPVSLRMIDYFCCCYSRSHGTVITRSVDNNIIHFNVHLSYRSQLKAYSKQLFDPFRRRDRILFSCGSPSSSDGEPIETTIGQLNFFRWAFQNDLLNYVIAHARSIEEDMLSAARSSAAAPSSSRQLHHQQQRAPTTSRPTVGHRAVGPKKLIAPALNIASMARGVVFE